MTDLNDTLGTAEVEKMTRSWLAYSATNIIFNDQREVLLGLRKEPAQSIPEPGEYALIGGFNTEVPGPAMLADVANAHAKAQLGIELDASQCSPFLPCEYDMAGIAEPLKTTFGAMPIKRVAFDRLVFLRADQKFTIKPQGKLAAAVWMSEDGFDALVKTGKLSFPYQVEHVREGFWWLKYMYLTIGAVPAKMGWLPPDMSK